MKSLGAILQDIYERGKDQERLPDEPKVPACPRCGGTGWLSHGLQEVGRERREELVPCSCNRPRIPVGPTFEEFRPDPQYPDLAAAYAMAVAWANKEGPPMLMLGGERGVGKTHLARAAYIAVIARGERAFWIKDGDLVGRIHRGFQDHDVDDWMARISNMTWLFIDDLGLTPLTDTMRAFYERIVDARWEGASLDRRTCYTTNQRFSSNPKLSDFSPRMTSRIMDKHLSAGMIIAAPDYRQKAR